jgi:predicted esterase
MPLGMHRTTLVIIHGRGSTAEKFAEPLLTHPVSPSSPTTSSKCFHAHFPTTKLIFPTAPLRRALVFNRSLIHQWFDTWSLTEPNVKAHLQIPGLRETSIYLHDLLNREIKVVGKGNVVLMGLSQGCATSLVAGMLFEGEGLGGVVGMCGYLPFTKEMADLVEDGQEAGEEEVFERNAEGDKSKTKLKKAVEWLREELEVESEGRVEEGWVPVFMGHGTEDENVPFDTGIASADFLRSVDVVVEWKEYQGLGHWYNGVMLRDVVRFLKGLKGWEDERDNVSIPV